MLGPAAMSSARDAAGATVPEDPSGLAITQLTDTSLRVTWTDKSNNEDSYRIYRAQNGGSFSLHTTLGDDVESYDDTSLTTGDTYEYKVAAVNEVGESTQVGPVGLTLEADVPEAPTNLSASAASDTQVDLSWTDNASNEDEYRVYRDGSLFDTIAADSTSYSATVLTEGTSYEWQVAAANSSGESRSDKVAQATELAPPTNMEGTFGGSTLFLSWDDNSSKEQNYEVHKDGSLFDTLGADAQSYSVGCPDAEGEFKVRAIHSTLPDSGFSSQVGATCGDAGGPVIT